MNYGSVYDTEIITEGRDPSVRVRTSRSGFWMKKDGFILTVDQDFKGRVVSKRLQAMVRAIAKTIAPTPRRTLMNGGAVSASRTTSRLQGKHISALHNVIITIPQQCSTASAQASCHVKKAQARTRVHVRKLLKALHLRSAMTLFFPSVHHAPFEKHPVSLLLYLKQSPDC